MLFCTFLRELEFWTLCLLQCLRFFWAFSEGLSFCLQLRRWPRLLVATRDNQIQLIREDRLYHAASRWRPLKDWLKHHDVVTFDLTQSFGIEAHHFYLAFQREALAPTVALARLAQRDSVRVAAGNVRYLLGAKERDDCWNRHDWVRIALGSYAKLAVLLAAPDVDLTALSERHRRD